MELHRRLKSILFSCFSNGIVFIDQITAGNMKGNLYTLNTTTGTQVWNYSGWVTDPSPAVANGAVYIGSGNNLYSFGASTTPSPTQTAQQATSNTPPIVTGQPTQTPTSAYISASPIQSPSPCSFSILAVVISAMTAAVIVTIVFASLRLARKQKQSKKLTASI